MSTSRGSIVPGSKEGLLAPAEYHASTSRTDFRLRPRAISEWYYTLFIVGGLVSPVLGRPVEAQTVVADDKCSECTIHVTEVARIGTRDGPGAISGPSIIARTRGGDYLISDPPDLSRFRVFDARGNYLKTVGRSGGGPGEFRSINAMVPMPDGRTLVFDRGLSRITEFTPEYRVMRSMPFQHPGINRFIPLSANQLLAAGEVWDPSIRGYPIHIFEDYQRIRSFGVESPVYRRDRPYLNRRVAALGRSGVWLIKPNRYEIEKWSLDGKMLTTLRRQAEWFTPYEQGNIPSRDTPPLPIVTNAWESPEGHLWIVSQVADPNWASALEIRGTLQGRPLLQPRSQYDYMDSLIEVIDPQSGQLLGSVRFPGLVRFIDQDGTLVSFMEDEGGYPFASILQVTVRTP